MTTWRKVATRPAAPRRAGAALVAAVLAVVSAAVSVIGVVAMAPARAEAYGASLTIVGRGNGHGDGLSQWGAYGYATTYAWDWHRILDHYYGGTNEATVDPATPLAVRLRTLDDQPFTAVVNSRRNLATTADQQAGRYGTVLAVETGSGVYKVYGRADAVCPTTAATGDLDRAGSGWAVVAAAVTSTPSAPVRLEVTVPGVDPATSDRTLLAGVCRPDATVRAYRGSIQIVNGSEGENRTVNVVPVDQYLRGVVPRESPASWGSAAGGAGMHALRAQSVAARTYGLAERRYSYAATCDTDACQVYGGAATRIGGPVGTLTLLEDTRTDTAVTDTAGVVLRDGAGALAYTQFNSSSGGFTSGANFPAVEDLGDAVAANPWNRWTVTRDRTAVEAAFPSVGSLTNVDVTKRNGIGEWGGRATSVTVRGTTGSQTVTGTAFANALGLPSSWFDIPAGCAGPTPTTATPPPAMLLFHQLAPQRLVDTRTGLNASVAPVAGGCVLSLRPGSLAQLPTDARAVSLNVTVTNPAAAGFVTVYPCDRGVPLASTVNFRTGQTVANQVTVPLDGNGEVCLYALQRTDVVIDLLGWFGLGASGITAAAAATGGDRFAPLAPTRVADTRTGLGGTAGPLPAGATLPVALTPAGLPAGAVPTAVVLNVTATEAANAGFLTVHACGTTRPLASNLNPVPGQDVAAHVVAPVGADGRVCVYTLQPTHVVVDVMGWYGAGTTGASFQSLPPARLVDTRSAGGPIVGLDPGRGILAVGVGGVPPTGVKAVVLNLTATGATGPGFATVYPCEGGLPPSSNLNYAVGLDVANMVTVPVGPSGTVCLYANRTVDLVVDVAGWYG